MCVNSKRCKEVGIVLLYQYSVKLLCVSGSLVQIPGTSSSETRAGDEIVRLLYIMVKTYACCVHVIKG